MRTPRPWEATLLAAAAFRTWKLLSDDKILDRPRYAVLNRIQDRYGDDAVDEASDFLSCPWCSGFWITAGWWAAWQRSPERATAAAVPWALSAAVGAAAHLLDG